MFTLKQLYDHFGSAMLLDCAEISYAPRMVALELLAQTFGWQYKIDGVEFLYTWMKKSGLFTPPIEERMLPMVVAEGNKGRFVGSLPAGMGF